MKKISIFTAFVLAFGLFLSSAAMAREGAAGAAGQQQMGQERGQAGQQMGQERAQAGQQMGQQQAKVKAANELQDFTVRNAQGEELGQVEQVGLDLQQGQIGYIVVEHEGENHIIPWQAVQPDMQQQSLTVDIQTERFQQSPTGELDAVDQQMGQQIHQFYGVSPYWEEGAQQQRQQQMQQQQRQQPQQQREGAGEQMPRGSQY